MQTLQVTPQTTFIIDLKSVCHYFEPYLHKHQVVAINWLEEQLTYPMFRELIQRWDNVTVAPEIVLRRNSYGAAVFEMQQMLNAIGYKVVPDGHLKSIVADLNLPHPDW